MTIPKWKYRKNPEDGGFQATFVTSAAAELELEPDWSDDPTSTGFQVRPATQVPESHVTEPPLFVPVTESTSKPIEASIEITLAGDING